MSKTIRNLLIIYLLAIALRLNVVKNYNFPFWFDPGRDAVISREIIENADLKIQGPTASGTNDTVYHGVFYYYFIGPLYTFFAGDPQLVLNTIILFSSLAVFAVFGLSYEFSANKNLALLSSLLYAFSFEAIRGNTWLSNPVIASTTIPFFFYLLFLVFFKKYSRESKRWKLLPLLAISLGLTHQSVILFVTLWGVVAVSFLYASQNKQFIKKVNLKVIFISFLVYLQSISTMILAQLKVWRAGIFSLKALGSFAASESGLQALKGTFQLYIAKISQVFFPGLPVLSVILFIILIFFLRKKFTKAKSVFLLLVFSSPLFLLSWHYRNMYHSFLALESIAVIILASFVFSLEKLKFARYLQVALILLFIFSNLSALKSESQIRSTDYYLPQGAYLREQLDLIDYSYYLAEGQDFSISSITNPYGYNTLWAYLYSWYGQNKYGYKPKFYGPSQKDLFGENLLAETEAPKETHFSIYEPPEGIPVWLKTEFKASQTGKAGNAVISKEFGSLELEMR